MTILTLFKSTTLTINHSCLLCGTHCKRVICDRCFSTLSFLDQNQCSLCAMPLGMNAICPSCLASPPKFDRIWCPLIYEGLISQLLNHYKERRHTGLIHFFSSLLAQHLPSSFSDSRSFFCITSPPSQQKRFCQRGFLRDCKTLEGWPRGKVCFKLHLAEIYKQLNAL